MPGQQKMLELFRIWLVGSVDSDNPAWVEVADLADGEVIGQFCVEKTVGGTDHGRTELDITFEDGSRMRVTMDPLDDVSKSRPKRKS